MYAQLELDNYCILILTVYPALLLLAKLLLIMICHICWVYKPSCVPSKLWRKIQHKNFFILLVRSSLHHKRECSGKNESRTRIFAWNKHTLAGCLNCLSNDWIGSRLTTEEKLPRHSLFDNRWSQALCRLCVLCLAIAVGLEKGPTKCAVLILG